jgi:glycosyltransferase involved in cell wall biosynthesis
MLKRLLSKWLKPNGISVLLSAQNEEKIIRMCVESFLEFGDEIIIVTNGSTDSTRDICKKLVEEHPERVQFYDKPELPDLSQNRAYALTKAKYRWVFRGDSDYIAYNDEDGKNSITNLRHRIMQTITLFPTSFWVEQVNISYKLKLTREVKINNDIPNKIPQTFGEGSMPRIYLNTPLLKFGKIGANEGVLYGVFYKQIFITQPYWFHITLKSDEDLFLRSARREWREQSDKYKNILDYIKKVHIPKYYFNKTFEEAKYEYIELVIKSNLIKYDENKYFQYPKRLKRIIDNE